mgnify:CR=1 FL=1
MKRKLLSILLTLCLALSLLPTAALADGEDTPAPAEVPAAAGIVLPEAADGVITLDNGAYVMSGDTTATIKVPNGKNATLDLNGKTLTNKTGEHTIIVENGATLTITGNGIVDNVSHGKAAVYNEGTVTLAGGTFKRSVEKGTYSSYSGNGNSWYTIANYGTMEINTGVTVENAGGYSSMIRNGSDRVTANCYLTIKGGNFAGGINTVKNDRFGVLTINGGNFSNTAQYVIMNWNKAEITAGTFQTLDTASAVLFTSAYDSDANTVGNLTISGGEFKRASDTQEMIVDHYDASNSGTAAVTGGKFDADISAYVPNGYIQNENGAVETLGETNAVAKVGGTYYKTLADAVAAAQDGDTITLLKDVDLGNTVTVANKTVTLNMAGKTIYNTKDLWDSKLNAWSLISVRENGNLTITGDGTLKAKADDCYALDTQEGSAKLTVENGTVIGNISAIYAFLGEVTINGGSYSIQQLNTNNVQDGYGLTINCYDQNYKEKTAKITVTGGYFAHFDPANNKAEGVGTNFVKDGYVSVTSDKSGYDYKVVKKTDTGSIVVKPAVAEPEVNVSDKISENDKPAVENAAKSVAVPTLGAAAGDKVAAMNKTDAERLVAEAENLRNPILYVQTALKVEPTAYNAENKTLTLDITPQYRIVASTADKADDIQLSGNSKNAQVVQDYQKLTITAPTVVTMELPTGFANANDKLSIKHIKDNGTVEYYTGVVSETAGTKTLTFTTNGFSPFTISAPAASIGETMYPTLAEAIAKAANGNTVELEKSCTESVTVSGKSLTIDKNSHEYNFDKVTVDANSTKTVSGDGKILTITYTAPSYSGGSSSSDPTYSVSTPSKTENGSVTVSPKSASKGDRVTVTVKPDSGYVLETLTVTDKNGNELTLKDKGNGKYTFTMPSGKVEVKATFMEDNSMLNFFYDVPNNAYFYEAVKWAVKNGITTGVGNDLFAPEQPCTRAQIVTFLWRAAGSPEPKGAASGMTDVVSGSYYEKAVAWAIENGITTGTTTTTFSPDATCTRAQAVTFLARALKAKAASAAEFSDVPTGSYFADAVAWAAANGVTEGIGGGLFGSDNDCTRGQIVTFLYRAYNK